MCRIITKILNICHTIKSGSYTTVEVEAMYWDGNGPDREKSA